MAKQITSRQENYSQWYNDLVVKAGLAENSAVRGCMVIKPYGYAIWEKMQRQLDKMFKDTGHENAYFPQPRGGARRRIRKGVCGCNPSPSDDKS